MPDRERAGRDGAGPGQAPRSRRDLPASPSESERGVSREFRMAIEQSKGPLPPADSFAGYERVLPGAAERIMRMAERQQVHRQRCEAAALTMDRQALNAGIRLEAAGLSCGFVIAIVFFLASCWLVYIGREIAGTLLGTVDIVALVGTFVYGRHMRLKAAAERVSED